MVYDDNTLYEEIAAELRAEREEQNRVHLRWAGVGCLAITLISAAIMGFAFYGLLQVL